MEKNVVNWFEIPVSDFERAKKFYTEVIGAELMDLEMPGSQMSAFKWVEGGEHATGALVKAEGYEPSDKGTVVYFSCADDLNNELAKVEPAGGKVLLPKTSIGEHGFIAQFIDSEGNRVALHSIR